MKPFWGTRNNMRVHELAKKLKLSSKDLIAELKKQGVKAKSHMELLDSKVAEAFLKQHAQAKPAVEKAQTRQTEAIKDSVHTKTVEEVKATKPARKPKGK